MRRREFITFLGTAGASWSLAAHAQQPVVPVVGFLNSTSDSEAFAAAAFRQGLSEVGYVEGQNVAVEYRWAGGQYDRLPALAADLVGRRVAIIVATGGPAPALAAKAATTTIPIVFGGGGDPVQFGLVASLNRPGGNVTGIYFMTNTLEAKRLGLLRELVPQATTIGVLLNPNFPPAEDQLRDLQEAARAIGLQLHVLRATTDRGIEAAFEAIAEQRLPAVTVAADVFFYISRDKLAALAARHAVPAMYSFREYAVAGGLMSYGIDLADAYRQVGVYAGRILRGDKPADLPVLQPTKFKFVINLKAAKVLGVKFSDNLMSLADEVIE